MDAANIRAWWWQRQGLDGSLNGASPAAVLERSGWARSVGGAGPYLTLFARAGTARQHADAATAALDIHELPAARGCTYVVPARDFALALRVGENFAMADTRTAFRIGVTEKEIDRLCDAVVSALDGGPLEPEAIRAATGAASRSLGEAGRNKGISTTLPLALGRLQAAGAIRRVPVNGRLDQQRYAYANWRPSPLASAESSVDEAMTELAARYFAWAGPATLDEFKGFAGLGVKAARQAVEALGLVPADTGSDRLLLPDDAIEYRKTRPARKPQYALVSSLDAITALRRDASSLVDDADRKRPVVADRKKAALGSFADLPDHAILDRGRLVGLWEYDADAGTLVWAAFDKPDRSLHEAVERTEEFVRDQLGDARSFSLDSPKSRAPRIAAIRAMQ